MNNIYFKKKFFLIFFSILLFFPTTAFTRLNNFNEDNEKSSQDLFINIPEETLDKFKKEIPQEEFKKISKVISLNKDVLSHFYLYSYHPSTDNPEYKEFFYKIKNLNYKKSLSNLKELDLKTEKLIYGYISKIWGEKHLHIIKKYGKFYEVIQRIGQWFYYYPELIKLHPELEYFDYKRKIKFSPQVHSAMLAPLKTNEFLKYFLSILVVEAGFRNYKSYMGALGIFQIYGLPLGKKIKKVDQSILKRFNVKNLNTWSLNLDHQIYWSLYKTARPLGLLYNISLNLDKSKIKQNNKIRLRKLKNLVDKLQKGYLLTDEEKLYFYKQKNVPYDKRELGLYDFVMAIYNGGPSSITRHMYSETKIYLVKCGNILNELNELEKNFLNSLSDIEKIDVKIILILRNNPELINVFSPYYSEFINYLWKNY